MLYWLRLILLIRGRLTRLNFSHFEWLGIHIVCFVVIRYLINDINNIKDICYFTY